MMRENAITELEFDVSGCDSTKKNVEKDFTFLSDLRISWDSAGRFISEYDDG